MARNAELIRQWEILRDIDGARHGISVAKLAAERRVHQRTIRRDLDALCRAGFPLYDEKCNGTSMWKLRLRPFQRLEDTGLGLSELCALYFSRSLLASLSGTPLREDAERALSKIERALPLASRRFLDELPLVLMAKPDARKTQDDRRMRETLARALDAVLLRRRVEMRYGKRSPSGRPQSQVYLLDPHRIVYAHGGVYLIAWVPAYGEMRTFALDRVETFALTDERFERRPLPVEPFGNSLGVNTAAPTDVLVEFSAAAAPYIRERQWHASQRILQRDDGTIVVSLRVCHDYALRAWILGFGADAKVIAPSALAQEVLEAASATRLRYLPERAVGQARLAATA
jgi:predicted DNA-binding transcriptional regulator YafY